MMKVFGPVPSRRLGRSLGVNFIPPKTCTYTCVYCQLGRTLKMPFERTEFFPPEEVAQEVAEKVQAVTDAGEGIDYLTLVPDGEPTLDRNVGRLIDCLKPLGIKIAVISNASLIWRTDVRQELMGADWVSLKLDAVSEAAWRKVDRPHRALQLDAILDGILTFASEYQGELVTETMLVQGGNDQENHLNAMAQFLVRLKPATSYLSIPIRPPAEKWVLPPTETVLHQAYQIFHEATGHVETLIGYEGNAFAASGNAEADLLSITAVHPMRQDAVDELLVRCQEDASIVDRLVEDGQLVASDYAGDRFYLRRFSRPSGAEG